MFNLRRQFTIILSKIKAIVNVFIPSSCIFCKQIISEEGMGVCPACFSSLPVWDKADIAMPKIPKNIDSFDALYIYNEPIDRAIKQFKFADKPEYAKPIAKLMCGHLLKEKNSIIMPVPMHYKRLFLRQFNQSALLAKELSKLTKIKVDIFSLKRIKKTAPQLGKSARGRKVNLIGAFKVEELAVKGKNIILIDDVWTTGSTAESCAKCLKQAGANRVDVLTICYVENSISNI